MNFSGNQVQMLAPNSIEDQKKSSPQFRNLLLYVAGIWDLFVLTDSSSNHPDAYSQ